MNEMSVFAKDIMHLKYSHINSYGVKESWEEIADRTVSNVMSVPGINIDQYVIDKIKLAVRLKKFIPGGRYLRSAGKEYHQTQNCALFSVEDSREGWADLLHKSSMSLMSGAGIGVVYSALRGEGFPLKKTGGTSTGPLALMQMINECGRGIMNGGDRRAAIWAGLHWNHPDIMKFIKMKNWSEDVKKMKAKDFSFPANMDMTNISVILDDHFFQDFNLKFISSNELQKLDAHLTYWSVIRQMLETGEPGFSIDIGNNAGEHLRNACCEITSRDDSDICNLGSINLARIESLEEMEEIVELATIFLLSGTLYSHVPTQKIDEIRTKNRRLGLGIMGIHEWLLTRGFSYGPNEELERYLKIYRTSTNIAHMYASLWGISKPVKTRAIAPTGTIGIIAETTTGIEPIFCVAYKRRYLKGDKWHYQYVIDPTAKKLIDMGIKSDNIEDAYILATDVERRIAFQAWVQEYVDHAISSTINLPSWGSSLNNESTVSTFGNMLMKYLPRLRGITVYPDGSRGGQPLIPVRYETAMKHNGLTFEEELVYEQADVCDISGKGGSCGS